MKKYTLYTRGTNSIIYEGVSLYFLAKTDRFSDKELDELSSLDVGEFYSVGYSILSRVE